MHEVWGKVLLDGWRGELGPATVYVRLLDTSRIDAPAHTIDEVVFQDVSLDQAQFDGIEFCVSTQELDVRARYEIYALVDLDGDGEVSVGDYVNTWSYPVLTRGSPDRVEVHVRPIG